MLMSKIFRILICYFCWISLIALCLLVCFAIFDDNFMFLETSSEEILRPRVKLHSSRENLYRICQVLGSCTNLIPFEIKFSA